MHRILATFFFLLFFYSLPAQTNVIVQAGHTDNISCQLFETKRSILLTGGNDGRIVQWEMKNGWQVGNILTQQTGIACMAFSKNEKLLATGGQDNSIVLLAYPTGKIIGRWTPFKYAASSIAFTPDEKFLVATSRDFSIWKYELSTGKIEQASGDDDLLALKVAPDNKTIYFGCRNGSVYKADLLKGLQKNNWHVVASFKDEITELDLSPDGDHLAFGTAGHYENDKEQYGMAGIINTASEKIIYQVNDFDMSITPHYQSIQWIDNDKLLYSNRSDSLKQWSVSSSSAKTYQYITNGRFLYNTELKILSIAQDEKINVYRNFNSEPALVLEGKLSIPKKIWLTADTSLFVEYDNGFKKWDLRIGRLKTVEDKLYNDDKESGFTISHNGRYMVKNERDMCMITDSKYPDNESYYPDATFLTAHASMFSPGDRYLAIVSAERILHVFDADSSFKTTIAYRISTDATGKIEIPKIVFSANGRYLALLSKDIYVFDLRKKTVVALDATRRALYSELDAVFSADNKDMISASHNVYSVAHPGMDTVNKEIIYVPKGIMGDAFYLVSEPGVLKHWNINTASKKASYFIIPAGNKIGDATALLLDDDGKTLFIGTSDNRVLKMDITTGNILASIKDHNDLVFGLQRVSSKHLLISASSDGTIKLRDDKTLVTIATLFALKNHGYVITDSSNYYKRSKNGASALVFQNGDEVFQPEQYDLYFNQPHRVLQKIGMSSQGLIDLFSDLYKKRASAQNVTTLPDLSRKISVEINEDQVPPVTDQKQIELKVTVAPVNTKAETLAVTVNGVPVINGSKGLALDIMPGRQGSEVVNIPLSRGINNVSVKAFGENGISSTERTFKVVYKPAQPQRPNLYVIVISVSKYLDASMNLKLAVKDGQDFMGIWKKDGKKTLGFPSQFQNIYDYTFFNEKATRENILAIKDTLARAKEEDMVVFYLSGHGMLDKEYNFWYGTHNVNFSDPAKGGVSYKELEALLDNIKPLRKVMLMDACHSGEVDKSLIKDVSSGKVPAGSRSTIKQYSYGGNKIAEAKDLGNTFEQMQEMFNSFSRNSGTIVISAAAGTGFAYEDAKWNNGVFTYALINGLKNKAADKNKDGDITIDELSAYVSKEVELLTNGMQKPNERQENTKNSFRIW